MKRLVILSVAVLALNACTAASRFESISATCRTYAVALNTAAALNRAGKLSADAVAKIDATIPPARAVCSGDAPTDDPAAVQKVADLVIAVLNAQGESR